MRSLFDEVSFECSKRITRAYSTSFSWAVNMLSPAIQKDIHSIYGFVRFADEIVDTFHEHDKTYLLDQFEWDFYSAMEHGISLNPVLNAFQKTVKSYDIDLGLVDAFLKSMRMDLTKKDYKTQQEYQDYIYGSADVVGLMCLKVFVGGDQALYDQLKPSAMRLGSAFQKVNFLRDLKADADILERSYFPDLDLKNLTPENKQLIIQEIEDDFKAAYQGIIQLPASAKYGVYTAFVYYKQLLNKLKKTPSSKIMETRIRVSNPSKVGLMVRSYLDVKLNLV